MENKHCDALKLLHFLSFFKMHKKILYSPEFISWEELHLLLFIRYYGSDSISNMAANTGIPVLDVSRMISRLQTRSILQKNVKSGDHRVVLPALTEKGCTILECITEHIMHFFAEETPADSLSAIRSRDFDNRYENADKPVILFKPVFNTENTITDLEFRQANQAAYNEFPNIKVLTRSKFLSRVPYHHFPIIISACNTVWKTQKPVRNIFDAKFPAREYSCECSRTQYDDIIFIGELVNDAAYEYLHDILPRYRYFYENKPAKMIIDCTTGKILEVNKTASAFYGWPREEFLCKSIYEISLSPPDAVRKKLEMTEETSESIFHAVHRSAAGKEIPVEIHVSAALLGTTKVHYSTIMADTKQELRAGRKFELDKITTTKFEAGFCSSTADDEQVITGMHELMHYLENNGKLCTYSAGDHFFEYGTILPTFAFIIDGLFRVYCVSAGGREYTLEYLRPGYVIDSITFSASFAADEVSIEAIVPGKIRIVEQNRFLGKAATEPNACKILHYLGNQRIYKLEQRELVLLSCNAKKRYEKFMQNESDIAGYLSGQDIAAYLGITPETLSRIRKDEQF